MNTLISSLLPLVLLNIANHGVAQEPLSICGDWDAHLEERDGVKQFENKLTLESVDSVHPVILNVSWPTSPIRCSLRISSCSFCILAFHLPSLAIEHFPDRHHAFYDFEYDCEMEAKSGMPCFNLEMIETRADFGLRAVDQVYRRQSIWSNPTTNYFNSSADSVIVTVFLWNVLPNTKLWDLAHSLFPLNITVLDNSEVINGTGGGFIESPRFPDAYPRQIQKNLTLINKNNKGFIRLLFDDFHLHFHSELRIVDSDGSELVNTRRERRRPAALVSSGHKLSVFFNARGYSQLVGFRARYEFVDEALWPEKPIAISFGDAIKLNNVGLRDSFVDCIWLIGRFPVISFERLYLKVEEFKLPGVGVRLEVREGASSIAERRLLLLDSMTSEQLALLQPSEGFTTRSIPAFYVRLRGFLSSRSPHISRCDNSICPGASEFHCDNGRCIKSSLRCDQVDNCGDRSDETCSLDAVQGFVTSDGNYSGAIAIIVSCSAVFCFLVVVTAVFAKLHRRRRMLRRSIAAERRLEAENCDAGAPSMQTVGERRFYVLPEGEVAVIEAPPSYDEALMHPTVLDAPSLPVYENPSFRETNEVGCSQNGWMSLQDLSGTSFIQDMPRRITTPDDSEKFNVTVEQGEGSDTNADD